MFSWCIKHGVQVAVIALLIFVLGIVAAMRIPVQMIPDLDVRTISVVTSWPGATPQDVEKEILIQQEDYLQNVAGLQRMISSSSTGSASIELEFPATVDTNDALIRILNALSQVPTYPENVDEPRVLATSFSSFFVNWSTRLRKHRREKVRSTPSHLENLESPRIKFLIVFRTGTPEERYVIGDKHG